MIMRKILTILTGLIALVSLSSCSGLDKEMNYTFGYNYAISIADSDAQQEVADFIESYFKTTERQPSYYGKLHDVFEQATVFFEKTVTASEVTEYFYNRIQAETDVIALEGYISSDNGPCWIGTWVWKWSDRHPAE
jgi:hypothetical protein